MKKTMMIAAIFCLVCAATVIGGGKEEYSKYVNEELGLSFEYPADFIETAPLYPGEITRFTKPNEYGVPVITVSVRDRSDDVQLIDLPGRVIKFMGVSIPGSSGFEILEEKSVELPDGADAVIVQFSWVLPDGSTVMETVSVFAFSGDRQFTVTANTIQGLGFSLDDLADSCLTLRVSL
jgi:hypothetical protein